MNTIEKLHTAFNELAPNGISQKAMTEARNLMARAGESDKAICLMITGAIYDGLAYGNWVGIK